MKLYWTIMILLFLLVGCKKSIYHVYSPDRKQCFTIKELNNERYIIAGYFIQTPDTNYIKLYADPLVSQNDELAGCWKDGKYDWQITINNATILENKLDTSKYKFSNTLPLDSILGIPTLKKFAVENCYHFGFNTFSIIPQNAAIIE